MIKLLIFIGVLILTYVALKSYLNHQFDKVLNKVKRPRMSEPGETEMVQDSFSKVYVPKNQAVSKSIKGEIHYFSSHDNAKRYVQEIANH